MSPATIDPEARALAQCYALLIRKAQERRARLAREAAEVVAEAEASHEVMESDTEDRRDG
jgi:hypothetical protein